MGCWGYDGESLQRGWTPKSKTFRPYDPDQHLLLPAALQKWLSPDHLATSPPKWWTKLGGSFLRESPCR